MASTARRAIDEAAAVAIASGVDITDEDRFGVFNTIVASGAARNKMSMCRDVLARRPSEVDAIYGALRSKQTERNRLRAVLIQELSLGFAGN